MAQNYTFNGSLNMTATSGTGYSQAQAASFSLNITGVDQIASGRIDVPIGSDATIMSAPGYGRIIYVKNMDDTNYVTVYDGASTSNDVIGVLEQVNFYLLLLEEQELQQLVQIQQL